MERALPALLALLHVDVDDAEWQGLDPPERRQRILAAVAAVLARESRVQPVCLVFEDLHWIDSETQAVLDRVVSALASERLLLLVSYRPGYEHDWRHASAYTELRLERLPPARSEELLAALLGRAPSLEPLTRLLIDRTDGNPLFIEESVRTLVETGTVVGEPGAFRLARPVEAIQVPPTVQVVVAARVDRLPPEEKNLLQIAAVIGRDVPYAVAREIADQSEDRLRRSFAHLQAAGFLCEAKIFPALEYTFKHSLTHEVAYQGLLQERRRALHARIVDVMERLYASHLADQVDHLAHHALQGELWSKALSYCRQAGARAFARSVPRLAVMRFEEALRVLEHLPESPQTLEHALDLRLELRYALTPLGEFGRILHELGIAERLARQLGDQRRLGIVSAFLSNHYTIMGDLARGAEHGERVLAIADALGDASLRVLANGALSMVDYRLGKYEQAIELARRNVDLLRGDLLGERFGMAPIASVYARTVLAWSLAEIGEFDDGAAVAREAIRIAEAAQHAHSLCFACHGLGVVWLRRGDLEGAVTVLERARELCEVADLPLLFPVVVAALASALAAAGRTAESLALLERGLQRAVDLGHPFGHWLRTGGLSEALLQAGRVDEALPLARLAVQTTRYVRVRGAEAWALSLLAEVAFRHAGPDVDDAEGCYRDALAIASELGMRPLAAHCHAGLARVHRRAGKPDQAQQCFATATTMYRAMGMTYWLEKTEAEATALHQG
jgi:tetratricopeptide (TPR) repeat protein